MISRMWHGVVPEEKEQLYQDFLIKRALVDYKSTKGNLGVLLTKKREVGRTHFYILTLWENIESIKMFAGEDYEKERYYTEDKNYLIEFEDKVIHSEVITT